MPIDRHKAETVDITPELERILAAVSYVIYIAERNGQRFTQYDVVKTLFLADRNHLNRFGRLITTDTYVAMIHGPVPSISYDLLKKNAFMLRKLRIQDLPWRSDDAGQGKLIFRDADIGFVEDVLSPSDKSAIEAAVTSVSSLSFGQIRKLTHEDAAYIDAWEDDSERKQFPMSLGLLFDTPNFEKAREIMDVSKL